MLVYIMGFWAPLFFATVKVDPFERISKVIVSMGLCYLVTKMVK